MISKEVCQMLENMGLTYEEMSNHLGLKLSKQYLYAVFKKHGIVHKNKKTRIKEKIKNENGSVAYLARKYKCSKSTICRIKKELKK